MIGIFGNDDPNPSREHVNKTEEVLKKLGKNYEFHRYDGCRPRLLQHLRGPPTGPSRRPTAGTRSSRS